MNEQETLVKLAYEQGKRDGLEQAAEICETLGADGYGTLYISAAIRGSDEIK